MLKNKLAKFVAKRVLICCIILSIIVVVVFEKRWYLLVGLLFGSLVSLAKLGSYAWVFGRIISANAGVTLKKTGASKSILVFAINQILLLPILYIAYKFSIWSFAGFITGILLVPFVIMINSVTEAIGVTKNNFE